MIESDIEEKHSVPVSRCRYFVSIFCPFGPMEASTTNLTRYSPHAYRPTNSREDQGLSSQRTIITASQPTQYRGYDEMSLVTKLAQLILNCRNATPGPWVDRMVPRVFLRYPHRSNHTLAIECQ